MMKELFFTDELPYSNILYIGDEPRACLLAIEDFNNRLGEIEYKYGEWFNSRRVQNKPGKHDKLHYHIQYHFEGGIACFKFKNNDELPYCIRRECFIACKCLIDEQLYYAS